MSDTPAPAIPMLTITVDGIDVLVPKGSTVMDACTVAQKEIPHFCYHDRLSIAGNCRMCLVEIEGMPKPIASCHWPAADGMKVKTGSPLTVEARKGTMEFLLINHPLDCPICDQGGECTLQDQAVAYGSDRTRYNEFKRAVDDKDIGSKIKTVMTRCIHCTRCVRFATEVAGVEEFGATGRGENMQIGTYVEQALQSELAGNMIDLCPVGALTSKPYAYTARPWELEAHDSIDILDAIGASIRVDTRAGQVMRVIPQENDAVNEEWLTDAARFSYDALSTNRLTAPRLKKGKVQYNVGWPEAFTKLKDTFKKANRAKIAGLMGDMHSAEDAYAFRAFMHGTLGTDHIDSRTDGSLLTGQPGQGGHASVILNTPLKSFDDADAILLIGCNPRLEAPLLNIRLRRAALKRRVPVYSIGSTMDLTYPHQSLGNNAEALQQLLAGNTAAADKLKAAQRPLILLSASLFNRPDALALLHTAGQLAERIGAVQTDDLNGWNGFNVLQTTGGRLSALDMGVFPQSGGKTTSAILKAWHSGQLDTLVVYGDGSLTPAQLEKAPGQSAGQGTLVYIGTHMSPIAQLADVVLPAAAWTEKPGLYANAEGRVQEAKRAAQPPLHAKEDWKIFRALSGELNQPLPFDSLDQLRALVADHCPAYAPAARGLVIKAAWQLPGTAGTLNAEPFAPAVTPDTYYLRTAYLRQSPTMHKCQAEQGAAKVTPPAALLPMPAQTKPINGKVL